MYRENPHFNNIQVYYLYSNTCTLSVSTVEHQYLICTCMFGTVHTITDIICFICDVNYICNGLQSTQVFFIIQRNWVN